jgi:hypothetical protein
MKQALLKFSLLLNVLILASAGAANAPAQSETQTRRARCDRGVDFTPGVIYEHDTHGLSLNRADRIRRIVEWFSQAP